MSPTTRLIGFANLLRDNEIPASPAELIDATNALTLMGAAGIAERDRFLAALEATLCKRAADRPRFRELFHLHFELADAHDLLPLEPAAGLELDLDEGVRPTVAQALIAGQAEVVASALQQALEGLDLRGMRTSLQLGYFSQRLLSRLDAPGIEAELRGLGPDLVVNERMLALRRAARRLIERELEKQGGRSRDRPLAERNFLRLSEREREEVRALIVRLAERMRDREQRRDQRRRRGRLDLRRTLRASLATGGVPMRIERKRKKRDKPQLFVLVDVSDSVEAASELLLTFVHALASRFSRVRSFVFVDELGEATALFRDHGLAEALARVHRGEVISVFRNSDYGSVLRQFEARHLGELGQRSHVLILGDGRSNHLDPGLDALAEVRRRCRALWWICPEARGTWGAGDSVMLSYARAVDRLFVARNVRELQRVVDQLVR